MHALRESVALLAVTFCGLSSFAAEVKVFDPESARKAVRDAKPGDVVVLAAGEWKDADLRLDGEGTEGNPITIRAEAPGKTIFTGVSRIRMGGSFLVLNGILLMNLSGANADWLEFRIDSKRRAHHCRVTDCVFIEEKDFTADEKENRWIGIYGTGNQIDHCTLQGKKNKGATLVVWLGESDTGGHRIVSNYFGERPRLGQNGGETIRLGDSKTSMTKAGCLVEGNYFFHCDGETECISNKSCGNIYRGNWFVETQGTLTLRHGNDCLVEENFFLGRKREQTGGIRVIGEGHRIVENYLRDLEGDGFRSAICLVNGIPGSPANGYHQVKNVLIEGNTIIDCKESLLIGHNDEEVATLAPEGVQFLKNQIVARKGQLAVRVELAPSRMMVWQGNTFSGQLDSNSIRLIGIDSVPVLGGGPGDQGLPKMPDAKAFGATWMKLP